MTPELVISIILAITGGGVLTSFVAVRKDRRDARSDELDFTKELRSIAIGEVNKLRQDMTTLNNRVTELEKLVSELESELRMKERTIGQMVAYIEQLLEIIHKVELPGVAVPEMPSAVKEYLRRRN